MPENPTIDRGQSERIEKALAKILAKQTRVIRYNEYYDGKHRFNFGSVKFTTQFAERLKELRENHCKTVVQAPADRLEVIGFQSDKTGELYNRSWNLWKYSEMPRLAKRIHREAFKTGDAFVLVWADAAGRARIVPQDSGRCCVFYDPETQAVEFGAKSWIGFDGLAYLTVYTRSAIYKYVSKNKHKAGDFPKKASAFAARQVEGEPWPVPNDYGKCPLLHFGLESSILDDVIPLNDALNKEIADLLIGSESNSLRQRWTTGIAYETDPETGKPIIPFERASQWFTTAETAGKFGEFADVSLSDFQTAIESFRMAIAAVSGIPHYFFKAGTGDFPSGEALRKAESRFTSRIKDAQLDFGETWAAAVRLALSIDNVAVREDENGLSPIETQWTPADPMSENERLDLAIKKKTIGVSDRRNLSELGYADADIAQMEADNQKAKQSAAETFSSVFDAGSAMTN